MGWPSKNSTFSEDQRLSGGGIKDDRYSEFQYNYEIKMDEENSCQL